MMQPYLVTKTHKSVGIAILLTLLFGPIGLFYASVSGGLIMTFLVPTFIVILSLSGVVLDNSVIIAWSLGLYIFLALFYWLITIIWAVSSVRIYNEDIDIEARQQIDIINKLQWKEENPININIHQSPTDALLSEKGHIERQLKPNLQDWLQSNPGETINDYYAKFGR